MIDEREKMKYDRLISTIRRNFRITYLYKFYLEEYPEYITADLISILTEDGEVSVEAAISALLSQAFGLDFDDGEDRRLIMDYITPSIRLLDSKKYEENPYYKNISLSDLTRGCWEIRNEEYKPYRAVVCDDLIINDDFSEIPPLGFFPDGFSFPAILENGNEWMTLTPVDIDTCDEAIAAAEGKVLTYGLGLGYFAYMASEKESVDSVTVVEISDEVIQLFKEYILPQMPNRHKIKIVNSDAISYAKEVMPEEKYDMVFVDTWRDASDGAPMYKDMKALEGSCPETKFYYWVENFLRSRCRAELYEKLLTGYSEGAFDLCYDEFAEKIRKI